MQGVHPGDGRPELLIPIRGRNACSVPDGLGTELLDLRPEPIEARPELAVLIPEEIRLGPDLIDLGPLLLAPVVLLPLELVECQAEPSRFHLRRFALGCDAFLGRHGGREFHIAVADHRREPFDLGTSGLEVGLPTLLALAGLSLPPGLVVDPGIVLTLEPKHLAANPVDLAPGPLDLRHQRRPLVHQRPDLTRRDLAQLGADRLQFGFEAITIGLELIPVGLELIPVGLELIPVGLELIPQGPEIVPFDPDLNSLAAALGEFGAELLHDHFQGIVLIADLVALGLEPIAFLRESIASGL